MVAKTYIRKVPSYIRRVPSSAVGTFSVILDSTSVENPVWTHLFNQGQKSASEYSIGEPPREILSNVIECQSKQHLIQK
jgi:hypothetical protein